MKKDLLVTLADKNYINQAKQLFSSVYWNAGWKGDYMLLSYEIPEEELKWFRDKGILIKRCEPLYDEQNNSKLALMLLKFYLFTPKFTKWRNIVYVDADMTVRASLDDLTKIKGFAAVQDSFRPKLRHQLIDPKKINKKLFRKFNKEYSLKSVTFMGGVIIFDTGIIKEEIFLKLKDIFETYREILHTAEQAILNLFFYKKWVKLPRIYNLTAYNLTIGYKIKPEEVKGIILHLPGFEPWDLKNYFYKEWKYNLERAESIDLSKNQDPAKVWSEKEIKTYCSYLKRKHIIFLIDRYIGRIGIFLKNNFPKLYSILKKKK